MVLLSRPKYFDTLGSSSVRLDRCVIFMNKVYISIIRSQLSVREQINGWLDISEKKSVR